MRGLGTRSGRLATMAAALAVLASAVLPPARATAATITLESPAFSSILSTTVVGPVGLPGSLPAFDAALGTLTGVSIRTIGLGSAFLTLDVPEAGIYAGPLVVSTSFFDSGGSLLGQAEQPFALIRGVADGPGPLLLQDGNSWATTIDITSGLPVFEWTDDYDVEVTFSGSVSGPDLPSQPFVADSYSGSMRVDSVTFTYTPVPEPSTALLMGAGLGMLGLRRASRSTRARARRSAGAVRGGRGRGRRPAPGRRRVVSPWRG